MLWVSARAVRQKAELLLVLVRDGLLSGLRQFSMASPATQGERWENGIDQELIIPS